VLTAGPAPLDGYPPVERRDDGPVPRSRRLVSVFARFAPRLQEAIVARLGWSSACARCRSWRARRCSTAQRRHAGADRRRQDRGVDVPDALDADGPPPRAWARSTSRRSRRCSTTRPSAWASTPRWWACAASSGTATRPRTERNALLREPAELLMTTPESLEVMLVSQRVDERKLFADLRMVVIDEVHALAGTDRGAHLISVIERLARSAARRAARGPERDRRQPHEILAWLQGTSQREGGWSIPPRRPASASCWSCTADLAARPRGRARRPRPEEPVLLPEPRADRGRRRAHARAGHRRVRAPQRGLARGARAGRGEASHGSDACIVCTSTLELGIDVGDLDLVLQAEAPDTVSSFLQRMGRTGRRAGRPPTPPSSARPPRGCCRRWRWSSWPRPAGSSRPVADPVLAGAHSPALAMSLASDGIGPRTPGRTCHACPTSRAFTAPSSTACCDWMLRDRATCSSGQLVLGPKAERASAEELHGALRGVLEPADLHGCRPPAAAARHARARASSIAWSRA
jgi:ATP-dependent Lhr-like helicase